MAASIRHTPWLCARLALCAAVAGSCLNPRPDDYPSRNDRDYLGENTDVDDPQAPLPVPTPQDDCEANPLDLSCGGSTGAEAPVGSGEVQADAGAPDAGAVDGGDGDTR